MVAQELVSASDRGEGHYETFRNEYDKRTTVLKAANDHLRDMNARAREIHATLHKSAPGSLDRATHMALIKEGRRLKSIYPALKKQRDAYRGDVAALSFMKGVRSLTRLRRSVMDPTSEAHADFIPILERLGRFKVLLFDKDAYANRDVDHVVHCGGTDVLTPVLSNRLFEPTYYVYLEKHNGVYENVLYDGRYTVSFDEIPEQVVEAVVDRVLEGHGGECSNIPEFSKARVLSLTRRSEECDEALDEALDGDGSLVPLIETGVVDAESRAHLLIGDTAPANDVAAGRWLSERVPFVRLPDFYEFNAIHPMWRRALSNGWTMSPFRLTRLSPGAPGAPGAGGLGGGRPRTKVLYRDRHSKDKVRMYDHEIERGADHVAPPREMEFASVSHYLMYCANPHLTARCGENAYSVFECGSGEPSAYTLSAARALLLSHAKRRAPKPQRRVSVRNGKGASVCASKDAPVADEYHALWCKYSDPRNEDLKRVLMATNDATIYIVKRGRMTRPFYTLMRVREKLRDSTRVYPV
jgi:hypothetical protein